MSHIVTIQTEVRDPLAVQAACQRLRLPPPVAGSHRLFSGHISGLAVQLPQWRYPVVCQLPTGQLHYDNYRGHWGDLRQLDQFKQAYAVEKAKLAARRQGHAVSEQPLADGSIQLTIQVLGS
ncbi:MAG: DUF1257 domain-containing protein [Pirellulaceae bacterium]